MMLAEEVGCGWSIDIAYLPELKIFSSGVEVTGAAESPN